MTTAATCSCFFCREARLRRPPTEADCQEMHGYRQRDGKTVRIDERGYVRRFLTSGAEDPEAIAGFTIDERVRDVLERRFLDEQPVIVEDLAFARSSQEAINEFNRSRNEWRHAAVALDEALANTGGEAMMRMSHAAVGAGLSLDDFAFADALREASVEDRQCFEKLVDAVNGAAGWLWAAVANLAEAAP